MADSENPSSTNTVADGSREHIPNHKPNEYTPTSTRPHSPLEKSTPQKKSNAFVLTLCLCQSFAGLLFGWEQSVISGAILLPDYIERFGAPDSTSSTGYTIPSTRRSLITAIMALGCLVGALSGGPLADMFGKKKCNFLGLGIFMIGIAIEISSKTNWIQIIFGRLIAGAGVGMLSMITPLFQAEASPKHLRGMLTGTYQLAATLGIFLSNCTNDGMKTYTGSITWRVPIGIQLAFGLLMMLGTSFMPESPKFFIKQGNEAQALTNLARLRGGPEDDEEIQAEFQEFLAERKLEIEAGDTTYWECFSKKDRMWQRTLTGMAVQMFQQTSGVNFFFSYGVQFFQSSGITDPYTIQIILSAVNVACTFPGLWAVEKLGRRETLLWGGVVMFIGQVVTGALGTAKPGDPVASKVLIAFSCIFIAGFAASWGPLGWVVSGELFKLRLAPKCISLATASNWLWNFILTIITPYITDEGYGNLQAKITFIWGGCILVALIFTFFFIPETSGLTLSQIDELYNSHVPAWRSSSWIPNSLHPYAAQEKLPRHKAALSQHIETSAPATRASSPVREQNGSSA